MKFIGKKIYIILLLLALISQGSELLAKDTTIQYTKENISNYFLGIISLKKNYNDKSYGGNDYSGAQVAIRAIRRY